MKSINPLFSFGPGAIVKKITFKKGIDFYKKIIIIISVKGRVSLDKRRLKLIHWQASPLDKNKEKHKKDIDTINKMCYNIIVKRKTQRLKKK